MFGTEKITTVKKLLHKSLDYVVSKLCIILGTSDIDFLIFRHRFCVMDEI
jgi:hypothetical protein